MYRKRLVCAAYERMNITEDQTRRLMYIGEMHEDRWLSAIIIVQTTKLVRPLK